MKKIGCGDYPIYHPRYPPDIMTIPSLTKRGISEKVSELYEKGHSTQAVAGELRISKTAVRDHLKESGVPDMLLKLPQWILLLPIGLLAVFASKQKQLN